ncbi:MAG: DNA gyrase C-terminal beta-propeller domain-containing protein, partial [Patescibacteria group bacterium]
QLRDMGRQAQGVRGMRLKSGDEIIGCEVIGKERKDAEVFVASTLGFGKRSKASEFKAQSRGGSGVKTMNVGESTGPLVAACVPDPAAEEFIAISAKGKTLRSHIKEIPTLKRATRGVRIMRFESGDRLTNIALL